eukprot:scaffold85889_cov39-Tisochrysis_lutea.AAC.8
MPKKVGALVYPDALWCPRLNWHQDDCCRHEHLVGHESKAQCAGQEPPGVECEHLAGCCVGQCPGQGPAGVPLAAAPPDVPLTSCGPKYAL